MRLQLENLGMKWPRCDTIVSPDNRNMSLKESCPDGVRKMLIKWSKEKFWRDWAENHECGKLKEGL